MTEPVGNGPRQSEIPSNSIKARQSRAAAPVSVQSEPKEKLESVVSGKVVVKKPPFHKRLARSFIAEDAHSVGDYILEDVIIPQIRNFLRDVTVGAIDRTLYGSVGVARRSVIGQGRSNAAPISQIRERYSRVTEESRGLPGPSFSQNQRARHAFNEIVIDSREEALAVLEQMIARIAKYRVATVVDLYDLLNITGDHADLNWGWTDLSTADVKQYQRVWLLDLPNPEPIR